MKNRKSLVWGLVGLAIVILLGGYFYNEDQKRRLAETEAIDKQQASAPEKEAETDTAAKTPDEKTDEAAAPKEDDTADKALAESDATSEEPSSVQETSTADADTEPVAAPQFDIVRVEPDGSTVIAGQAKAGAVVEVVTGDTVLAESQVGESGDFAAIFDDPLEPGDYEIVLRVVEEGEVVAQSEEVATVSVPEENPEALLVIVTKPGEASRILTQPEAVDTASATGEKPMAAATDDKVATTAEADEKQAPSDSTTASSGDEAASKPQMTAEKADAETNVETAQADDGGMSPSSSVKEATEAAEIKAAEVEQPSADASTSSTTEMAAVEEKPEPDTTGQQGASAEAAKPVPSATEQQDASGEAAKPAPSATERASVASDAESSVPADAKLRIDAVEIEKGRVFVAGSATPGASVRVYADGTAIGDSNVSTTGRFLVEAEHEIAVGQHTISADLMMPGSDAATMRVAVPFTRPEGDAVAAVAAPAETTEKNTTRTDQGETNKPAEQAAMAKTADDAAVPAAAADQVAASGEEETSMSKPEAETTEDKSMVAEEKQATETAMVKPTGQQNQDETAKADSVEPKATTTTADTKSAGQAASSEAVEATPTDQKAMEETAEAKPAEQGAATAASNDATSQDDKLAASDTRTSEPETVVQQALEPKEGSVIIRRGDTLWQISRRVYGRGVRYTTIYLANSDQISNPDFIEPGQIFMVPNEPLSNAEQLHRERIKRR